MKVRKMWPFLAFSESRWIWKKLFSDVFKGVCIHFRWDDDVVFKNCAKDDDKPKVMRRMRGLCVFKS